MIYLPKVCATCAGSKRSLDIVNEVYENNKDKKIYVYKEILHNKRVMDSLKEKNIETVEDLSLAKDGIVILRAHGEGEDTYKFLEENGIEFFDATCPKVSGIHSLVNKKYKEGYDIVIIGKASHPETIGINGWCKNDATIVEKEEDIDKLLPNNKKFVICQTTFNKEKFEYLSNIIKEKYNDSIIMNTHCAAVEMIIASSVELAKNMDIMFVIGGQNSSNTEELYKKVSETCESYKFSNINDFYTFIKEKDLTSDMNIGITGGASTPISEIEEYKSLLNFMCFYKERLKEINANQEDINLSLIKKDDNEIVKCVVNDFIDLNKDGKYVRASLIALGKLLSSGTAEGYLPLAYAYEMFETSVLVHDDIIDKASLRRGKKTINNRIENKYNDITGSKDLASSIALCIGDFGFYEANNLIVTSYKDSPYLSDILKKYNDIIIKTIKGEILDVYLPFLGKNNLKAITETDVLDIYHLKTSWYTIIGPLSLGIILGGKKVDADLEKVLNLIGISFQLKDDILGIFSESKVIGKSNTSDIEEYKQTLLYTHILTTKYKDEFLKLYGKENITEKELEKIRDLLIQSGSKEYALNYLKNLEKEVKDNLDKLKIDENVKDIIKGLLVFINIRTK